MASTNNEKIDAYLSGNLSGKESTAFDRQLQQEATLKEEVTFWQSIDQALEDEATVDFQQKVVRAGKEYLASRQGAAAPVRQLRGTRRYLAIAATLLLLITAGLFLWNNPFTQEYSGKELYATNFETYDLGASQNRSGLETSPTIDFATGVQQYKAGDFAAAATTFAALLANDKSNMALTFALAQAQLNLNPPDLTAAGNLLQSVITDGKSAYVTSAHWYLALVKLQQEKPKEAKELLTVVQASAGQDLKEKATAILQTLE